MLGEFENEIEKKFNSLNGGIPWILDRFSDALVQIGLESFYQRSHSELNDPNKIAMRDHWHLFRRGMKSLDNEALLERITSLNNPFKKITEITTEHQRCSDSLEKSVSHWMLTTNRFKQILTQWKSWMVNAEINYQKDFFPLKNYNLLEVQAHLKFGCALPMLDSHGRLGSDIKNFESQIKIFRDAASQGYIKADLPKHFSIYEFDTAYDALMTIQAEISALERRLQEVSQELETAKNTYFEKRRPLIDLLRNIPPEAQWALFNIVSPELQKSSEIQFPIFFLPQKASVT